MKVILLLVSLFPNESIAEYDLAAIKSLGGDEHLFNMINGDKINGSVPYEIIINNDSYGDVIITEPENLSSNNELVRLLNEVVNYSELNESDKKNISINDDAITHKVNIIIPNFLLEKHKSKKSISAFIVNYRYNSSYTNDYSYNGIFNTKFLSNGFSINNNFYLSDKVKELKSSYIEYVSEDLKRHLVGDSYLKDSMFSGISFFGYQVTPYKSAIKIIGGFKDEYYFASTASLVQVVQDDNVIFSTEVPAGKFYLPNLELNSSGPAYIRITGSDGRIITYPYVINDVNILIDNDWSSFAIGYEKNSNKYFISYAYSKNPYSIGFLLGENTLNLAADWRFGNKNLLFETTNKFSLLNGVGFVSSSSLTKKINRDDYFLISHYLSTEYNTFDVDFSNEHYVNLNYSGYFQAIKTRYKIGLNYDFINSSDRYQITFGRNFKYFNVFLSGSYSSDINIGLNVNIPISSDSSISSYSTYSNKSYTSNFNFSGRLNNDIQYNIGANHGDKKSDLYLKGNINSDIAEISLSSLIRESSNYYSVGVAGSVVLSKQGGHLTSNIVSDTFSIINVDNDSNEKIRGRGYTIGRENKQIIKNLHPYKENKVSIVLENKKGNVKSSIYKTINPSFGNVYFSDFKVKNSELYIFQILINNKSPDFGAMITNSKGGYLGQIGMDGFFALDKKEDSVIIFSKNKQCNIIINNILKDVVNKIEDVC